jgi:hypothetical protein
MPLEWQQRYADLMEELSAAYDGQPDPEFEVRTVRWEYLDDLGDEEKQKLGITRLGDDEDDDEADGPEEYVGPDGTTLRQGERVAIPVPDPVPHYRHAYLPPDEAAIAAVRTARDAERADAPVEL